MKWLFLALFAEGLALMLFSRMTTVPLIVVSLVVFSLFVQMSEGATYSVVPFVNRQALGAVSGIVGAGGNAGAVASMLLFRKEATGLEWPDAFLIVGAAVTLCSFLAFGIRFSPAAEFEARAASARGQAAVAEPAPA